MYLLLAAIVLLLLFAASFGGRGTWVALTSTTLTVLLVAACAFIASASSAGPFFKSLAEGLPASLNGGVEDLAYAALELHHPGWEINDGAGGALEIDVTAETFMLDCKLRYTAYDDHYTEL